MKIRQFCLCFIIYFSSYSFIIGQKANSFSLPQAIEYAQQHNLSLKNALLNVKEADARIIESRSIGLPQINGEIGYQYFLEVPSSVLPESFEELIRIGNGGELPPDFSRKTQFGYKNNFNVGFTLRSLLFDAGYIVGLQAAKLYRTFAQQQVITKEKDIKSQVVEAYLPALITTENIAIIDKNIVQLQQLLKETKALYKEGFVEQLDVDRIDLSLSNLSVERENLSQQHLLVVNGLKMLIGFPLDSQLVITDNIESLLEEPNNNDMTSTINPYSRPEYRLSELNEDLNTLNIKYNQSGYLPNLEASLNYFYAFQGNQLSGDPNSFWAPSSVVGLTINIPIFDGFYKKAKIQQSRLELERASNQKEELRRAITLEVKNARISYKNASSRLAFQQKNMKLAEKIYNTTKIKYKEGIGSSIEMIQAEQSVYQTQQLHIQAMYEVLLAKSALKKALGH